MRIKAPTFFGLIPLLFSGFLSVAAEPSNHQSASSENAAFMSRVMAERMEQPLCARGLFEVTKTTYPYDFSKLRKQALVNNPNMKRLPEPAQDAVFAVGFHGLIPTSNNTKTVVHRIHEWAFMATDTEQKRQNWTQISAIYPAEDGALVEDGNWLLDATGTNIPLQIEIANAGANNHTRLKADHRWSTTTTYPVFLVPHFESFGFTLRNIRDEFFDPVIYSMKCTSTGGIQRCVWKPARSASNQEFGVEISTKHSNRVYKTWSGQPEDPRNIAYYSNFFQTASGVYFPKDTTKVTQIALTNSVYILQEEHFKVLGSNVVIGCNFDHSIFNLEAYAW